MPDGARLDAAVGALLEDFAAVVVAVDDFPAEVDEAVDDEGGGGGVAFCPGIGGNGTGVTL